MSKDIRIVIVEDELIIAESIKLSLEALGYFVYEPTINFTTALQLIGLQKPDLVFIDIRLSGSKDGIDLAAEINSLFNIPFIYLTSNSDPKTIDRAKKTSPSAFLVKPFNKADLYAAIEIALYNHHMKTTINELKNTTTDYLFVKHNQAFIKLFFHEIAYINSQHVYIEINTITHKKYLVRSTFADYSKLLPSFFIKIHRSYIINSNYLETLQAKELVVAGNKLPISDQYRNSILAFIK